MDEKQKIRRKRAFTLVELLAVLAIFSILVGLAVSVGSSVLNQAKRQETRGIQSTVIEAVHTYYRKKKSYPLSPIESGGILVAKLREVEAAYEKLIKLPQGIVMNVSDAQSSGIKDAYEREMTYESQGALGGRGPVLISAGADDEWGTSDDIYSDNR